MKNDLWIWLDWQNPPQSRCVAVDDLWAKLKDIGDPKSPSEEVCLKFRSVMAIPRPVVGADYIPPTNDWVNELYTQFLDWMKENRKDLYAPKQKKPETARA
jgi:hypothetical protein